MILVLDDHPIARQGIESIIRMCRQDETVIQAGTVREAIRCSQEEKPDMAFIDINLGKESGFEYLEWLERSSLPTKTFMITSSSDETDFLHAKSFDVDAYLLKDAFIDDIVYGLRVVERGGKFYSSALLEGIVSESDEEKTVDSLSAREVDVLLLLKEGRSNAAIGQELYISEGTVKKHISGIFSKLGIENRIEAVLFARRNERRLKLSKRYAENMRR